MAGDERVLRYSASNVPGACRAVPADSPVDAESVQLVAACSSQPRARIPCVAEHRVTANRDKIATRERILEAAMDEFARYGFAQTTVRSIAKRASISHAAIHWHFGSKSTVYAETVRLAGGRFIQAVRRSGQADLSFPDAATAWIRHLKDDTPTARLLRSLGADHRHPTVEETAKSVNSAFRDFWQDWLREHLRGHRKPDADVTDLAQVIVATLTGMAILQFHGEPKPSLVSLIGLVRLIEHP